MHLHGGLLFGGLHMKRKQNILLRDIRINGSLYLMVLPVIAFYILFHYFPMSGAVIAFKNYKPARGIWGSSWVGMKHFSDFLSNFYFQRTLRTTLLINLYTLLFSFPAPILFALILNEVKNRPFKRTVQTISYFPHFISLVVVCGMLTEFCLSDGLFNQVLGIFGIESRPLLQDPALFRTIYVGSGLWQSIGWSSIVYLAAIAGIDGGLYEAAALDGAGRWRCMWHVTLPGIKQTVIVLLILQIGKMMNVSADKVILLYNNATMETADVISSFVYRRGLLELNWSFSTAVGLFNSVINCLLVLGANALSRKLTDSSLF